MLSLYPRYGSFFDDYNAWGSSFGPAVHVRESEGGLYLEVEVPRYHRDEVKVEHVGHDLIITGNREVSQQHMTHGQLLAGEAPLSRFRREVRIPLTFDMTMMSSTLENGVLSVFIPRAPQAPPPEPGVPLPITVVHSLNHGHPNHAPVTFTDRTGLMVTASSSPSEFNAVANMKWPPKIRVDETNNIMRYIVTMPASVTQDHIEMSLIGRFIHLVVHHHRNVVKRDTKDHVVYSNDQSVSYSTNLMVPEGVISSDISTTYDYGELTVTVSKHPNPVQAVPVK